MKYQMIVAAVLCTTFVTALAASNQNTRGMSVAFLLIGSIAAGYVENLTLSAVGLLWEPDDLGLVGGVLGAVRSAAGAIATAMYSSILTSESSKYLPQYVGPAAVEAGLPESSVPSLLASLSTGNFTGVEGITADITTAVRVATWDAYSISYRTVFLCTLPFGVILLIASVLAPNVEDYLTDEVARRLHMPNEEKMDVKHKDLMMDDRGSEVDAHAATREVV
jgi:hypothetical protein